MKSSGCARICCVMHDEVQVRHRDKVLPANAVVAHDEMQVSS